LLNQQVEKKIPTFLYLVKGNRNKSTVYRALLTHVQKEKPQGKKLIPPYYVEKDIVQFMKAWIKVERIEPIAMAEIENLKTLNSVLPISETLRLSSAGYFLVHESKSIF